MTDPRKIADAWAPMPEPFISIGQGHRLFVRDWGAGHPVLLLAGWALDSSVWAETMVRLNLLGLRAIAYDRRGHGRSTDPGTATFDSLADDLWAVVHTLDLWDLTIVAHSGAAGEVIRFISRHGADRIGRLILLAPMGPCMLAGDDNRDGLPRAAVEATIKELREDYARWIDANAGPFAPGVSPRTIDSIALSMLACSRRILVDFQQAILEADMRVEAAQLELPVTVIHGTKDASAPLDVTGRRFAGLVPQARLVIYEDAAHGLMLTHANRLAHDVYEAVNPHCDPVRAKPAREVLSDRETQGHGAGR